MKFVPFGEDNHFFFYLKFEIHETKLGNNVLNKLMLKYREDEINDGANVFVSFSFEHIKYLNNIVQTNKMHI